MDAVTYLVRLCKPNVVQVVMQPFELLRQGHLKEAKLNLGFLLAA